MAGVDRATRRQTARRTCRRGSDRRQKLINFTRSERFAPQSKRLRRDDAARHDADTTPTNDVITELRTLHARREIAPESGPDAGNAAVWGL